MANLLGIFMIRKFVLVFGLICLLGANDFDEMTRAYSKADIEFPNLKAVTLAMMILESGRGESNLAKVHKNYAGLKYRHQIKDYAQKIRYKASDGYDYYSSFKDHDSFIKGFWAFLDRSPYKGWRKKAHSAKEFLEKIAPIYCPFNKNYVEQVMALVPEATKRLNKSKTYKNHSYKTPEFVFLE